MEFTVPHTVDAVRDTVLSSCAGSPLYLDRDGGHELENLSESGTGGVKSSFCGPGSPPQLQSG